MSKPSDRDRLRVLFLATSMPVGGAETLLVNLVRRLNPARFAPEIVCLKERGPLGEELANEFPVHANFLAHKFDLRVLPRLARLMCEPAADAVVTVGAGDKMFWGRLAARWAGTPVVASALHSTGWPDSVGRLNRSLTRWTDAFIGVAQSHGRHLTEQEGFPAEKVHVIPNGVDCQRFAPRDGAAMRRSLGISDDAAVVGILAALRPEKNHELFLSGARRILQAMPRARFLVIGDGPRRVELKQLACELGVSEATMFLGSRSDVPEMLAACDLVALTSHNEASPVSILEALAVERPVVAADVGSIRETVEDGKTGYLFPAGDEDRFVQRTISLLDDRTQLRRFGAEGRRRVQAQWSLESMVHGYEQLIERIYALKTGLGRATAAGAAKRTTGYAGRQAAMRRLSIGEW